MEDMSNMFEEFVEEFQKRLPDDARCYSKEIEAGLRWFSAKIIAEFPVPLKLSNYMLQEMPGKLVWVEDIHGKGFHVGKGKLEKLIKKMASGIVK